MDEGLVHCKAERGVAWDGVEEIGNTVNMFSIGLQTDWKIMNIHAVFDGQALRWRRGYGLQKVGDALLGLRGSWGV